MTNYFYKAVNQSGRVVKRHINAVSDSDFESQIDALKLDLISFKICKLRRSRTKNQIRPKELITITLHIQQLLNAGLPILDVLKDLRNSTSCIGVKDITTGLIDGISSGQTFSQALSQFPGTFNYVYVNTIHVGETSGQLVKVMDDLVNMLRWQYELEKKVKKVSVYPFFVLTIVSSVTAFLMLYLVPQLTPFLMITAEDIPWYTELLIRLSRYLQKYWPLIVALPALGYISLKLAKRYSLKFNEETDRVSLVLPVFGPLARKIKMARFCNMFALMYSSGITILDSIKISATVVNNSALENALLTVLNKISDGNSISQSFEDANLFPDIVVRMIGVGETTGDMTLALSNAYYFLNNEVKNAIDMLEPVVMPLITILLGSIVGWIMFSIMGPLYDAVTNLSFL